MKYVLIDAVGNYREMEAPCAPIRVAQYQPVQWALAYTHPTKSTCSVIEFADSGLVDGNVTVLTPNGESVPLGKYPRQVFRRGRGLWVDVVVSDLQRCAVNIPIDTLVLSMAMSAMRDLVVDKTVQFGSFNSIERTRQVPA